jgi:NAD(P)-dependent dehydrogenase (short-subunit alcohol dehydrogenase family)
MQRCERSAPVKDPVLDSKPILERFRLDGRVALVTGGGQGIGRAFCHALAEAGARVAVVDVAEERAQTVAHELVSKHAEAIAVTADVTREGDIQRMIHTIVNHWGSLGIGVNNAGVGAWIDAEKVTRADWARVLALDLEAVFFCAQAEARVMFPSGYGKIINTASMSGHIVNTPQKQVPYNTSKAGVMHMTRSLAAEWADRGIRVNSISPGYTRTMLVDDLVATPEGRTMMERWMPLIPLHRMADVTDLQGAVVYLASPASDYMTGHDIVIDGGYCVW